MKTYEDLCMSVKNIGETLGLDYEISPMRKRTYKDGISISYLADMRIIFKNNNSLIPVGYSYHLSPYDWNRIQNDDTEYDEFITFLTTRVKENIC